MNEFVGLGGGGKGRQGNVRLWRNATKMSEEYKKVRGVVFGNRLVKGRAKSYGPCSPPGGVEDLEY